MSNTSSYTLLAGCLDNLPAAKGLTRFYRQWEIIDSKRRLPDPYGDFSRAAMCREKDRALWLTERETREKHVRTYIRMYGDETNFYCMLIFYLGYELKYGTLKKEKVEEKNKEDYETVLRNVVDSNRLEDNAGHEYDWLMQARSSMIADCLQRGITMLQKWEKNLEKEDD